MANSGGCGSVTDHSGALQGRLFGGIMDCYCSSLRGEFYQHVSPCYHGGARKDRHMWGDKEISLVICRRIRMGYLCFTYIPFLYCYISYPFFRIPKFQVYPLTPPPNAARPIFPFSHFYKNDIVANRRHKPE